jgi:hypothetical protein
LRISVKARTFKVTSADFIKYNDFDLFDWLAVVLLYPEGGRKIYLIPRAVADARCRKDRATSKTAHERYWPIHKTCDWFKEFEGNFALKVTGNI